MPKITGKYETIFIVDVTLGEEKTAELVTKFTSLIEANSENVKISEWGKRRLAYEITKKTEGFYVLVEFECKPEFPAELDRIYKITDGIMRTIIIAK